MNVPEVSKQTALESTPWIPADGTLPKLIYVDHVTSYEDFFQNILLKNQLCIIGPEVAANWASRKNWVMSDGSPNFAYLKEHFGESVAPVADCNSEEFCAHPKTEMAVKEYLTYWQSFRSQDDTQSRTCLYLKDWHLTRDFPGYSEYQTPMVLCSDWMNEFWDVWEDKGKTDDYRFVYMGPVGSWTPFHADVLQSYSWSANICGKKKWIFFPPGAENSLKDKHGHLVFDLQSADLQDSAKYPEGSSAVAAAITVIQNPGEIIFVPSGWHHEVFNMEDTVSVNHNWINGCSAHLSWDYLKNRLLAVQKEIADCKNMEGWHQQCQVMLKADSGIDYINFYTFMARIATHRITVLNKYIEAQRTAGPQRTADPLNISYSSSDIISPSCDKHRQNRDKKGDNDEQTGTDCNMCQMKHEDDAERLKTWECLHAVTKKKHTLKEVSALVNQLAIDDQQNLSVKKNNHSFNKFSIQPQRKTCSCDSINAHDVVSQPFDNKGLYKLAPSCCKSASGSNLTDQVCSYLCLFKGTLVNVAERMCQNDGSIQKRSGRPYDGVDGDDDDFNHQRCPHWAHTGPNLALFDLCRVLDIVQDMKDCEEFKIAVEEQEGRERILIPPAELVVQIESTVRSVM